MTHDETPMRRALRGLALQAGDALAVRLDPHPHVVTRRRHPDRRVTLVSGGGSGHEPMHAGFIGPGGLDAAAPGEVFTSPHNGQILAATRELADEHGAVFIVKNYTGDVINFRVAAERLRAEGIPVETVIVDDDHGSQAAAEGVGRRGTAATVLVEKVLGAAADAGLGLAELAELGREVVASSRTLAVAWGAHLSPETGEPGFAVEPGTLEYGVGIHGETAAETIDDPGVPALVRRMVGELLGAIPDGDAPLVVLVSGLGGASNLQLSAILAEVAEALAERDETIATATAGTLVSALDMRGFSLTLARAEDSWLRHWSAEGVDCQLPAPVRPGAVAEEEAGADEGASAEAPLLDRLHAAFGDRRRAFDALDQTVGDGDMGGNLSGGFGLARKRHREGTGRAAELGTAAEVFLDEVGGSSGPLVGLLFQELAGSEDIRTGLAGAQEAIQRVGGAAPGDRTLLDALAPAAEHDFGPKAAAAALQGAIGTKDLAGSRGRSSYLGDRVVGHPDPGAVAVALLCALLLEEGSETAIAAVDELLP